MKSFKYLLKYISIVCLLLISPWSEAQVLIQHWVTSKGAAVYFVPTSTLPMLDLKVAFAAGSAYDRNTFGLAALTLNMLNQGNKGMNATQIAEGFEKIGARLGSSLDRDKAVLSLKTLSDPKHLTQALRYFQYVVQSPDFPEKAFLREQKNTLIAMAQTEESPASVAEKHFFAALYPNQPYGHPILGQEETVKKMKRADLERFYKTYYVAQNAMIILVGNVTRAQAEKIAFNVSEGLPEGKKAPPLPPGSHALTKPIHQHINFPSHQTVIQLGSLGISHLDPDYFPLIVGNYILGGGSLVSRLASEIREKRGLSYYIYSYFDPLLSQGPFIITLATRNKQALEALSLTQKTFARFIEEGPTPAELEDAKKYLIGSFPLKLDSNAALAGVLLTIGFYHLPLQYLDTYQDKIAAVTLSEVKAAFKKHMDPEASVTVTVGGNA